MKYNVILFRTILQFTPGITHHSVDEVRMLEIVKSFFEAYPQGKVSITRVE